MSKNFSQFQQELNSSTELDESVQFGLVLVNNLRESKITGVDDEHALSELIETWLSLDIQRILTEEEPLPTEDQLGGTLGTEPQEEPEDIEAKIEAAIDTNEDDAQKEQLVNLRDFIPTLKKFSGASYKKILLILYQFIMNDKDEKNITPLDKQVMADVAFDIMKIIIKNDKLTSIIGTEAKVSVNESLMEEYLIEAKKKNKKKKETYDKVTPKLEMLLRLGLVDKPLFTRAKKALTSKKESGSIPQYRNIIFDILDKVVKYIEKDPTLYNRMRVNVMKEMKQSLPKKQMVMDAYLAGQEAKKNGKKEIPEEFANEQFLKSAWNRGFNDKELEEASNPNLKELKAMISALKLPTDKEHRVLSDTGYSWVKSGGDADAMLRDIVKAAAKSGFKPGEEGEYSNDKFKLVIHKTYGKTKSKNQFGIELKKIQETTEPENLSELSDIAKGTKDPLMGLAQHIKKIPFGKLFSKKKKKV